MDTHLVYLGLGSNIPPKTSRLVVAMSSLERKVGSILKVSPFYSTNPVNFISEKTFINTCISLLTTLSPTELLREILEIEKSLGREKKTINGIHFDRTIDIDILFYDDIVVNINAGQLQIPHPQIWKRDFVYRPLMEIMDKKEYQKYRHLS